MTQFGLQGVAIVWTGRVAVDAIAMFYVASSLNAQLKWRFKYIAWLLLALMILFSGSWINSFLVRLPYTIIIILLFAVAAWRCLLLSSERDYVKQHIKQRLKFFKGSIA
jgi:hypothetical protein